MKHKVVIEIDGIRHRPVSSRKIKNACSVCSLAKFCPDIIGSPCCSVINYFKLEKSKGK